jgi:hypothetical protein
MRLTIAMLIVCSGCQKFVEQAEKQAAANRAEYQAYGDFLEKVKRNIDAAAPLGDKRCADDQLLAPDPADPGIRAPTLAEGYLKRRGQPLPLADPEYRWQFLQNAPVWIDPSYADHFRVEQIHQLARRGHFFVVRVESKQAPAITKGPSFLDKDAVFKGGYVTGWLLLVDTKTGTLECQTRFAAHSSANMKYRSGGPLPEHPDEVVFDDLKDQYWKAANEAVARISSRVTIGEL